MARKSRRWDAVCEDEPGSGLINLFDVWIAFSVALLLALFGYMKNNPPRPPTATDQSGAPAALTEVLKNPQKTPRFRPVNAPLSGQGTRLGTAYQLENGEVVYVPDGESPPP